ncbi:winged helix DNA-binding domain-containing protein [Capillimicrobium parvum]|uniref:Winged helix DNA-binding domain-containing protein n=1 Tax=Capillimicrobium parvum TaxID=2884022 RepID=A0A9E7C5K5_9ACTN|nr:winged helix DNA-binding domain-containing protein [Capillimicrobium parvum]UGS38592.1 hypothetical protein DSM104329_05022 [Capillimicrobium parvum]
MIALRRPRAAAQLLHRPHALAPEGLVRRLLAVQAQDLAGAYLALRARTPGLTAAAVGAALTEDRSLVVTWLCRGTLHLVAPGDLPWLLALTAPGRLTASRRRLGQEGVTPDEAERGVAIVERALAADGPLTRAQLAERLDAQGVRTAGQALIHLLGLAGLHGLVVRGPVVAGGGQAFVLARDWIGEPPGGAPDRDAALAELARRYLAAHGPAGPADLATWSGLPLRDARAGLSAIAGELVELEDGLVDLARREPVPERVPPRLLPAFDPYLLGWRDRSFAVPAQHARRVHPGGGMLRAAATRDGVAVGTWSARRRDGRLQVEFDPFAPLDASTAAALDDEIADVARFEGLSR